MKTLRPASVLRDETNQARARIAQEARIDAAKQIEKAKDEGAYLCKIKPHHLLHDVMPLVEELKRLGYTATNTTDSNDGTVIIVSWRVPTS